MNISFLITLRSQWLGELRWLMNAQTWLAGSRGGRSRDGSCLGLATSRVSVWMVLPSLQRSTRPGDRWLLGFGENHGHARRITLTSCVSSTGLDVEDAKNARRYRTLQGLPSPGKQPGRPHSVAALTPPSQSCQSQPEAGTGADRPWSSEGGRQGRQWGSLELWARDGP